MKLKHLEIEECRVYETASRGIHVEFKLKEAGTKIIGRYFKENKNVNDIVDYYRLLLDDSIKVHHFKYEMEDGQVELTLIRTC